MNYLEVVGWFSVAGFIGWVIILTFRLGIEGSVPSALLAFFVISAICFLPAALVLRKPNRERVLKVGSLVSLVVFALLNLVGPALVPRPQYAFLKGQRYHSYNAGVMGYGWHVYNFEGDLEEVMKVAQAELESKGFKCANLRSKNKPYKPNLSCDLPSSDPYVNFGNSVSISEGKVDGSHFVIDGDFLDTEPAPGWVIVGVGFVDDFAALKMLFGVR